MAQYDDLNSRQIWAVGIVSAALTAVTILAVQVLYYALLNRHNDVKQGESEYRVSNGYLAAEAAEINRYGRDAETGAVRIPIDRAMKLVVERKAESAPAETSEEPAENANSKPEEPAEPAAEKPAEKPSETAAEKPASEPSEEAATEPSDESDQPTAGDDEV